MNIELINNKGQFEIWADGHHVNDIKRIIGEGAALYESRANMVFEKYVDELKQIHRGQQGKRIIKTVTI